VKNFNDWLTGDFDTLVLLNKVRLDNDDFDITEFMKHYDAKKRKSENDKDIDSNSNSNKPKTLTLADLE